MICVSSIERKKAMPRIVTKDPRGNTINYHEFQGKRFPPVPVQFHDLDVSLPKLPDIPCRDDDVTIVTYPKAGMYTFPVPLLHNSH